MKQIGKKLTILGIGALLSINTLAAVNLNDASCKVECTDKQKKPHKQHIQVYNDDKYSVDAKTGKLLVNNQKGKKDIAKFTIFDEVDMISVSHEETKNGNDIITVDQTIQGALTSTGCSIFYIKDGEVKKVIEQIECEPGVVVDNSVLTTDENVIMCNKNVLSVYDDKTGELVETKDLSKFVPHISLETYDKDFLLGQVDGRLTLIDFKADKAQRIYDLIPSEEDKAYVFEDDLQFASDRINYMGRTGDTLTFGYESITEQTNKEITYTLGK